MKRKLSSLSFLGWSRGPKLVGSCKIVCFVGNRYGCISDSLLGNTLDWDLSKLQFIMSVVEYDLDSSGGIMEVSCANFMLFSRVLKLVLLRLWGPFVWTTGLSPVLCHSFLFVKKFRLTEFGKRVFVFYKLREYAWNHTQQFQCHCNSFQQIQKLVAPPISDDAARRSKRRNRTAEHRRHGRTVNHDCCDSCKEGGDLLCCDRCPAAFHLLCQWVVFLSFFMLM